MKGLLMKDILLLKNQNKFFAVIGMMCVGMLFVNLNPTFVISYTTLIVSMFTLSTISYDEFDNGSAFLFALPVSRKGYVAEKYLFGLLTGGITWCLVSLIVAVVAAVKQEMEFTEVILTALVFLMMAIMILAVTLPLQLKFGAEKSRIALIGVVGAAFMIAFLIVKGMQYLKFDIDAVLTDLMTMDSVGFIGKLGLVCILSFVISFFISVKIMEKKQF